MRSRPARVILPPGELRYVASLRRIQEDITRDVAPLSVGDGAPARWFLLGSSWITFTVVCWFAARSQGTWLGVWNQDLDGPIAALQRRTEGPARQLASFGALSSGGPSRQKAVHKAPVPAPSPPPPPVAAAPGFTLGAAQLAALPPAPRPTFQFGRWSPTDGAQRTQREADAQSGAEARAAAPAAGACDSALDPTCSSSKLTAAELSGSWGDPERAASPRVPAAVVAVPSPVAAPQLAARAPVSSAERPRFPQDSAAPPAALPHRRATPEPVPEPPVAAAPPREQAPSTAVAGQSCEAAFAKAEDVAEFGRGAKSGAIPDVPREAYAQLLENEPFANCRLDQSVEIQICAAVKNGHAEGVTVTTRPGDAALSRCVAQRVRRMNFPRSTKLDLVRTEITIR